MSHPEAQSARSVTVRSVAERAGVSVATVSRVLSRTGTVGKERTQRVLDAARDLGYRPDPIARSLSTGSTRRISVIVPNLSNPYFYDVIRGIGRASAAEGYSMTVADSMEDSAAESALATDMLQQTDALILISPRATIEHLEALGREPKPVLSLLGPRAATGIPDVSVDNLGGMRQVYAHLADLGHRRVVYLAGPPGAHQDQRRLEAIPYAEKAGIEVIVHPAGGTIDAGRLAVDRALQEGPTAIACFNDLVALGALHRLTERGIVVPDELSLTGFDDIDFSAYSAPALTTARTPREQLGRSAWCAVQRMLRGEGADLVAPDLPAELVVRGSTGAVHRRGTTQLGARPVEGQGGLSLPPTRGGAGAA